MHKVVVKTFNKGNAVDGYPRLSFCWNDDVIYDFSLDINEIEELIAWCFSNTTSRFQMVGTSHFYFESADDALKFKLTWG